MLLKSETPKRKPEQKSVLQLACKPIHNVRIAFIGLGKRGKESFHNYMHLEGVAVVAICDTLEQNTKEIQQVLLTHEKPLADAYTGIDDWRLICERSDIDLVYICTERSLHTPIAVYAMQCGKHVAIEVPAANTVEECWQLVNTAEETQKHCIMLENCCYGFDELTVLNMKQQGVLGEIFHAEGAYIHDLRQLDFDAKKHYLDVWKMQGNPYPTHGLGPLCQLLEIHRSDSLAWLSSVSSGQFNYPQKVSEEFKQACVLGNINTTILRTERGKTITLQHDISSPRPYSRNYLISGTEGFVQNRDSFQISLSENSGEFLSKEDTELLVKKYEHPFYKEMGDLAREVGGHGGMDFIMDYRLIYCLQNGLPLDMDVYDAAEWSCIVELSAKSVANNSQPIAIPDFTRSQSF